MAADPDSEVIGTNYLAAFEPDSDDGIESVAAMAVMGLGGARATARDVGELMVSLAMRGGTSGIREDAGREFVAELAAYAVRELSGVACPDWVGMDAAMAEALLGLRGALAGLGLA